MNIAFCKACIAAEAELEPRFCAQVFIFIRASTLRVISSCIMQPLKLEPVERK